MPRTNYTEKIRFEIRTAGTFTTTDVDLVNDVVALSAHALKTGDAIGFSTTGGVPTGLTVTTAYYVILNGANSIGFATSRANAMAGTKVNLTGVGTGVTTVYEGGTGTILSGVIIPANHYVIDSHYLVHTTGVATATTGTLAIQVESANDIVSAAAISTSVWDDTGAMVEGIVDLATEASYILTTEDREVSFLTGTSPWSAGKIDVFLNIMPALA